MIVTGIEVTVKCREMTESGVLNGIVSSPVVEHAPPQDHHAVESYAVKVG